MLQSKNHFKAYIFYSSLKPMWRGPNASWCPLAGTSVGGEPPCWAELRGRVLQGRRTGQGPGGDGRGMGAVVAVRAGNWELK